MRRTGTGGVNARHGFTLVELLVALAIGALLLLTVHQLVAAAVDQSQALGRHGHAFGRMANASRWLADAFGSLDVGAGGAGRGGEVQGGPGPFAGNARDVAFSTWLVTERGWHELERVDIRLRGSQLVARHRGGDLVLADSVADVRFDYLLERRESAPWLPGWTSAVNAPLAVRIRVLRGSHSSDAAAAVDTLVFVIGDRG